ncbi:MBL fold metallo-hydrolase [Flagellimonas allohymeniacidonis]|uniref:MBL fold metallo-hydrolase n=2 Tax=Flagellimonas allohymeniacidonis TaxID=2517819 RepID=A0A4Q8QD75_9FLAO|nr:MBL fold metallo-hydrolase [Allomuricauda hymeniacidonis]
MIGRTLLVTKSTIMRNSILILIAVLGLQSIVGQKQLEDYKKVLPKTLERSINFDITKGYAIQKVKPNIYVLTDGIWQSVAVVTTQGVVLIDSPESFGAKIQEAVKSVSNQPITTLIYSHGHSDHIGGSQHLSNIKNLEIISLTGTEAFLREQNDPRRLIPNKTFEGAFILKKGNTRIHLNNHMNHHSPEGDLFISIPEQQFLMVIDVLAPDYVPFKNLDLSNNIHEYLQVFDQILAYDFDVFVGGHLTSLGTRKDVEITKAYVDDVHSTVTRIHQNTNAMAVMSAAAEKVGWDNKYLLFKVFLDKVIDDSYAEIELRWINKLAGVDVWGRSHVSTMLNYVRWDD